MILVDMEVASLNRHYQFSLDENAPVTEVISEVRDIICQKEQCQLIGDPDTLSLCSKEQQNILRPDSSLSAQGIQNADRLLLV